jgi:hypothetical protein
LLFSAVRKKSFSDCGNQQYADYTFSSGGSILRSVELLCAPIPYLQLFTVGVTEQVCPGRDYMSGIFIAFEFKGSPSVVNGPFTVLLIPTKRFPYLRQDVVLMNMECIKQVGSEIGSTMCSEIWTAIFTAFHIRLFQIEKFAGHRTVVALD